MNGGPKNEHHFVMAEAAEAIVWVGYGFTDGVHRYIFWFPVDWIDGGDAGAILIGGI